MKLFIINLSICLLFNMLAETTLIGHFSMFYIQVMILFITEEIILRFKKDYWIYTSTEDLEYARLYDVVMTKCPQLSSDIVELGSLVSLNYIPMPKTAQLISPITGQTVQQSLNFSNEDIGMTWLVARGYTADKLDELIEDMPRMLIYLKNAQTAKAIEDL